MFIGSHFYIEQFFKRCSTHSCVLSLCGKKVFSQVNNKHGGKELFNFFDNSNPLT